MGKIRRVCEGCGQIKLLAYTSDFCDICKWSRGKLWILHMTEDVNEEWEWELVDFK